ncbi:MAG: ATP-binding protein [Candidatus Omnitrophota bacterium]
MILFEKERGQEYAAQKDTEGYDKKITKIIPEAENARIKRLKRELEAAREYREAVIEEKELITEKLTSANEEIQSSNEELQSTNEELETSKEELQSSNEELVTLNEELQNRNKALSEAVNDINNFLTSVNIPIIMLGFNLRIRRFTPTAQKALNIIDADIGRKITDIKINIDIPDLEKLFIEVINNLNVIEREVQDKNGHWYQLFLRPYRTTDYKIEGAVLSLLDINDIKKTQQQISLARVYAENIINTLHEALIVLNKDFKVVSVNRAFCDTFKVSQKQIINLPIYEFSKRQWNIPQLRKLLKDVLLKGKSFKNFGFEHEFPLLGKKVLLFNACQVRGSQEKEKKILLAIEDITKQREVEKKEREFIAQAAAAKVEREKSEELRKAYEELKQTKYMLIQSEKLSSLGQLASGIAHELNSPLDGLLTLIRINRRKMKQGSAEYKEAALMVSSTEYMAKIIKDLGCFARQSKAVFGIIDLNDAIESTLSFSRQQLIDKGIKVTKKYAKRLLKIKADKGQIQQIVLNMITNARDAMPKGGKLIIKTSNSKDGKKVLAEFIDNGIGIKKEHLPKIFDPFFTTKEAGRGIGLGLSISHGIIKNHNGEITAKSTFRHGSQFTIELPAVKTKRKKV